MSEAAPAASAEQPKASPAADSKGEDVKATPAAAAAASSGGAHAKYDSKADGGSLAGSAGGTIKEAAPAFVHKHIDNSAAINANCTAAWNGKVDVLKEAKEGLFELGVVLRDGEKYGLFFVAEGDKSSKDAAKKPYRLLPLSALIELPAPPKAALNPDESYFDEPKGGETMKALPPQFAFWRAPVFYAAAAGRKDVVEELLAHHRDCAADRARIYTAKAKGESKWEVLENAAENATTPKPKFVDAAAVARANGFDDVALALEKSYRMCSTEDCSIM